MLDDHLYEMKRIVNQIKSAKDTRYR